MQEKVESGVCVWVLSAVCLFDFCNVQIGVKLMGSVEGCVGGIMREYS